ncbi:Clp protease N-terminal domain-containing protein [Leifsonia sp. YIM 134122]|uniref:Clp protease N-terminal domain-containing protein n=1 Tax=Leifsonia stereocauli TaxID=3134136 RepID=A0ABU9W032_9MICO
MSGGLAADARLVAEILSAAEGAALNSGSPRIGAEHLLIGCLTTMDPSARTAVAADGIDDRAVRAALARVLDRAVLTGAAQTVVYAGDPDGVPEGTPPLSPDGTSVLQRARVLSRMHRPRGLQAADVLVAVAELEDGTARAVLDDLGVDRQRLFDFRDWAAGH